MNKHIKKEILLLFIPFIGIWFVLDKILPSLKPITWWDYNEKAIYFIFGSLIYQSIFLLLLKIICIHYAT